MVTPVFLLETSAQRDKIVNAHVREQIATIKSVGAVQSSHFVLYEYKISLIKSCIDFYFLVEIGGFDQAALHYANARGRKPKDAAWVLAAMHGILGSVNTGDTDGFLIGLETIIVFLASAFGESLDGELVGSFADDQIVGHEINSRDDFRAFSDLYESRKTIPLDDFFRENRNQLDTLVCANLPKRNKSGKLPEYLGKIQNDPMRANGYYINKSVGDVVISIDAPVSHTVVTLDSFLVTLCGYLGKQAKKLTKK